MSPAAPSLARRQQALLLRSAALRDDLGRQLAPLATPLALADQARAGWHWLRARPLVPLTTLAVVVVMRPRRAWRLGWRVWAAWRGWQRLHRFLHAP